jgi:uncharacterized protein YeaO (DUF488 family)
MIYTKSIFKRPTKADGIRISVMSRHTLNDGITPDMRITSETYNCWYRELSPPEKLVGAFINQKISWEQYTNSYIKYLREPSIYPKVIALANKGLNKNLTLLCVEESANRCHRRLLAEECQFYCPKLIVIHK